MWAHYADKHRGLVIGLKPNIEEGSALMHMRPVTYTENRPNFIESTRSNEIGKSPIELAEEAFYRVFYSKSTEWAYEQELRLAIPSVIPPGEKKYLMNLCSNEVAVVYLGCRLLKDSDKGQHIITMAKTLNPEVKIFQAQSAKRSYKLEFERIY